MKPKADYIPPELQPDTITDYITGDLIYIVDYFADMPWLKVEGILFVVAIAGAIIFKWYRKLDVHPTEKPATTMGEDAKRFLSKITNSTKLVSKLKKKLKRKDKDE